MIKSLPLSAIAAACTGTVMGDASVTVTGLAIDSRAVKPGDLFVAIHGARVDGHDYVAAAAQAGAAALLVQREVSADLPQLRVTDIEAAVAAVGRLARADFDGVLVGITGSAGKTTAKNLLAAVLAEAGVVRATEGNRNNELGVPLTLAELSTDTEFAVLEMGAGKPGDIAWLRDIARPSVGVLLNVAPAHLEFFGTLDAIADTKGAIIEHLPANGLAVFNGDQPWADAWRRRAAPARVVTFGQGETVDYRAEGVRLQDFAGSEFSLATPTGEFAVTLRIPGRQGIDNALAAAAVAHSLGVSPAAITRGLASVEPAPGRGRVHALGAELRLVDDCYNANPLAVRAAIDVLARCTGERVLVLGDMLELGEQAAAMHAEIGEYARANGIHTLYAIGALAKHAVASFGAGAHAFADVDALLAADITLPERGTVLVKASRGAALDRVVAAWLEVSLEESC